MKVTFEHYYNGLNSRYISFYLHNLYVSRSTSDDAVTVRFRDFQVSFLPYLPFRILIGIVEPEPSSVPHALLKHTPTK